MFKWISQLIRPTASDTGSPAARLAASAASNSPTDKLPTAQPVATTPEEAEAAHPMGAFNVQTESLHWVFSLPGSHSAAHVPAGGIVPGAALGLAQVAELVERMSLDSGRAADWVPRVPTVLVGLLRSLRHEASSESDLAALLEQDLSLLAEALKEANSALYQRTAPVTRTEDAVRLLGNQGLRMLIAKVSFRPVLGPDAGPLTQAGANRVWALSETCSRACRDLAPGRGVDPFEAFLSGLALQVGLLITLRMADRVAHLARPDAHGLGPRRVPLNDHDAHASTNQSAQDLMQMVALLSHRVAARWELPEEVIGTLTGLTDPLARRRWHNACQLLVEAQEAARLQALDEAGWLPAPLLECAHHLPDDVRNWLAKPPAADT